MTAPRLTGEQAYALAGFDQDLLNAIDAGDLAKRDRLLDLLDEIGLPSIASRAREIYGQLDTLDHHVN